MPVLGICGGQQLLNVALGGTLIQHIPDEVPARCRTGSQTRATSRVIRPHRRRDAAPSDHRRRASRPSIARIIRRSRTPAPASSIDAMAEDGVIEGIEDPRRHFCLGVQWHPEFEISEADRRIFRAFVEAAAN